MNREIFKILKTYIKDHKNVPVKEKLILLAMLLWIILPDFIPGPIDDFVVFIMFISYFIGNIIKYFPIYLENNIKFRDQNNDSETIEVDYEEIDEDKTK